ncbi:VQ motif-containing protein 1-like [Capsicum galapagoense]
MSTREGVKIVIINTEYIHTDASSFKSVVQKLTGKNSSTSLAPMTSRGRNISGHRRSDGHDDKLLLKDLPPLDELLGLYTDEVVRYMQ